MTCKVEWNFIVVFDQDLLCNYGPIDQIDQMASLAIKSGYDSVCLVTKNKYLHACIN